MWLSSEGKSDIHWWLLNLNNSKIIRRSDPDLELCTDALEQGWGAHMDIRHTSGHWLDSEFAHINILELRAILFGLKSLCRGTHIHIRI